MLHVVLPANFVTNLGKGKQKPRQGVFIAFLHRAQSLYEILLVLLESSPGGGAGSFHKLIYHQ